MLKELPLWLIYCLAGVFLFLFGVLGLFQWGGMHELDFHLARILQQQGSHAPDNSRLDENILIVNVSGEGGPEGFRQRLGELLVELSQSDRGPAKIALDIAFVSSTSENGWEKQFLPVQMGLEALARAPEKIPVYGAMEVLINDHFDPNYASHHALTSLMDGVGHTWFRRAKLLLSSWPYYEACGVGEARLLSLPVLLAKNSVCEKTDSSERLIPLGGALSERQPEQILDFDPGCKVSHWRQYKATDCLKTPPKLGGKTLIIGRLADDHPITHGPFANRSGPELVAWAVNDLNTNNTGWLVVNDALLLGVVALTVASTLLAFFGAMRFVPRWRLSRWQPACVAGTLGGLVPFCMVWVMHIVDRDFSQVSLPIMSMLLALGLAVHYQYRRSSAAERKRATLPDQALAAFDVFVSYRHSHQQWVEETLKPLLTTLRRVNGDEVQVFFDLTGIHAGNNWATRLGQVIHESRIFLAVLTPDYFEKNEQDQQVCRWEMEQALQRHAENAMEIVPIYHAGYSPEKNTPAELPHLKPIQALFSDSPELAERLNDRLLHVLDKGI